MTDLPFTPLPGTRARRRLYLMRHGDVDYRVPSSASAHIDTLPLTNRGEAQARAMGEVLRDVPFDHAAHTGLHRTRHTAELVLGSREIDLVPVERLKEMRTGNIRAWSRDRMEREFNSSFANATDPDRTFAEGGETYRQFWDRVMPAFLALATAPGWTHMLLVAHGGTNRNILAWACGAGLAGIGRWEQDSGCLNVIDLDMAPGDPDGAETAGSMQVAHAMLRLANFRPENPAHIGNNRTVLEQMVLDVRGSRDESAA
ncbi:histidine phosphatase family protein [Marinibaculum pumilum]|uniref:Histidine phosphatase family protein n=1 Tax=Marinibaculum pumilum TaxID=1766165 RepID=A0ABV7L7B1_9PROT